MCPVCKVVVERDDLVRGFEVSKGKYVQFTEEQLQSLETEANKSIDLKEFIPIDKVDPVILRMLTMSVRTKAERNRIGF